MVIMKTERITLFCLISLLINTLSAQSVSEKRSYMKTLPVSSITKLEVINKYGDVNITTWNKDSVYIRSEIEAFAPTETKLRKMFEGITTDFTGAGSIVRAKTGFDQNILVILESFKGLTDKIIDYDSRVKISYFISIPDYADIHVENQFGDITMGSNKGVVSVSLSNGDFKAGSLNKLSEFTLNFGEAEIGFVASGKINSTFSEFVISESGDLSFNSTSSRFNLKKAGRITFESRRDKVFAEDISELKGASYFTDFKIENLLKEIDLTLKYGSLDIEKTDTRFDKINLVSVFSDITLAFDPSASYDFEIKHTNAFVVTPGKITNLDKEALNEVKKEYLTTGTYGKNPGTRRVDIDATRGNIYLK